MRKKKTVMLCTVLLAVSLAACGGKGEESSAESTPTQENSADSTQEADAAGDEAEAGENGEAAGGSEEGWSQEMVKLRTAAVEAADGGYWPDMAMESDMLEMTFGITSDMYEDYMAEMPMMSTHVDTLLIVRAKDDKVEAVEEALKAYRDAKIGDTMQYPMNVGKIQASRIETIGNYVMFVQLGGDTTEAEEQGDEAIVKLCQERNDKVIEAIRGQL